MKRRVFLGLVPTMGLAGCASDEPDAKTTASPMSGWAVVADETLLMDREYSLELPAGARLTITVDVQTGGPVDVLVHRLGAGDDHALSEQVDTGAEFRVEIDAAGSYHVNIWDVDQAYVRIVSLP